jgi:hypothetical protein
MIIDLVILRVYPVDTPITDNMYLLADGRAGTGRKPSFYSIIIIFNEQSPNN